MRVRLSEGGELVFAVGIEDTAIGVTLGGGGHALDEMSSLAIASNGEKICSGPGPPGRRSSDMASPGTV